MKLSGKAAEAFLAKPDPGIWCAVIFCEDDGVAADAGAALYGAWSGNDPTERIILTEDEISKSPALLFDTLEARSLLGDQRILFVRLSNEKISKHFVSAIEEAEARTNAFETKVILTSAALKKASKLRKIAESATRSVALQLFEDSESDTEARVRSSLSANNISISDSALATFLAGLPRDRRLVRSEIEKLALYGHGLRRPIEVSDVQAISAAGVEQAQHLLVSNALQGHASSALAELDRLETAGTSPISLLRAFQREAERLISAHAAGISDPGGAMKLRPPVWRDQWPAFRVMLRIWSAPKLMRLMTRIRDCEADAKLSGAMAGASVRQLVTDILRRASAASTR